MNLENGFSVCESGEVLTVPCCVVTEFGGSGSVRKSAGAIADRDKLSPGACFREETKRPQPVGQRWMKNSCIRPGSSDILSLRKASEKMKSHGKGVIILSHNTWSRRGNLNCLRASLPSENLPRADAARAHI